MDTSPHVLDPLPAAVNNLEHLNELSETNL